MSNKPIVVTIILFFSFISYIAGYITASVIERNNFVKITQISSPTPMILPVQDGLAEIQETPTPSSSITSRYKIPTDEEIAHLRKAFESNKTLETAKDLALGYELRSSYALETQNYDDFARISVEAIEFENNLDDDMRPFPDMQSTAYINNVDIWMHKDGSAFLKLLQSPYLPMSWKMEMIDDLRVSIQDGYPSKEDDTNREKKPLKE